LVNQILDCRQNIKGIAGFFVFFKNEGDYFRWNYQNPVHFNDDFFSQAIRFHNYYLAQHKKILNKFTTYTSEEASIQYNICDLKEETKKITSLRFSYAKQKGTGKQGNICSVMD
jgi:hypothetical protein